MSYLWACARQNCHKLVILVTVLLMSFVSVSSYASQNETAPDSTSREALFQRAYKSIGFIFFQASQDTVFLNWLTPTEKQMFEALLEISNSINTYNWLQNNKIEKITDVDGSQVWGYSVAGNRPYAVPVLPAAKNDLIFSDDTKIFDLHDGKPERTAITERRMGSPIYINRKRINNPKRPITLGDAFLLLTHELGRKLGAREVEPAVDSLGTKLKQFIDSQISTSEFADTKIHLLHFPKSNFTGWVNETLRLEKTRVSNRNESPLWLLDQEGFYILLERAGGFHDLTESFLQPFRSTPIIEYDESNRDYVWKRFNWFNPQWVQLKEKSPGKIELSFSYDQFQLVIPFFHNGSPDPRAANPYGKFMLTSFGGGRLGHSREIELSTAKLGRVQQSLVRLDDPSYEVTLVSKQWENDDLVFVYKIVGKNEYEFDSTPGLKMQISPELVLSFDNKEFEVKSTQVVGKTNHYEFRLPNIKKSNSGSIQVIGLEFGAKRVNVSQVGTNVRIQTYLPSEEKADLEGSKSKNSVVLKSVSIWNGSAWTPLATDYLTLVPRGSKLRFIFNSQEKLRTLELTQSNDVTQKYTVYDRSSSGIRYEVATVTRGKVGVTSVLSFDAKQMNQKLNEDSTLTVDIEADEGVDLKSKIYTKPDIPIDILNQLNDPDPEIETVSEAGAQRAILKIRTVSESLEVQEFPMKKFLLFRKADVPKPKDPTSTDAPSCKQILK